MQTDEGTIICVDLDGHGKWHVTIPGTPAGVDCAKLSEARQIAYACAADRHPCELVVRDAYHRVLSDERIDN